MHYVRIIFIKILFSISFFYFNNNIIGIAVLIEYSVFSLLVYWIFASDIDLHETAALIHSNSHFNPEDRPNITWGQWVKNVFNIMDLFHNLNPTGDNSLTSKLNPDEVSFIELCYLTSIIFLIQTNFFF